jgi:peptidoglycan/LPS O-acetylase OafA/YrhL
MNKRLVELDSIRGLAAISVLFGHIVSLSSVPSILAISPLRIFWLGHGAVIFFFILSDMYFH